DGLDSQLCRADVGDRRRRRGGFVRDGVKQPVPAPVVGEEVDVIVGGTGCGGPRDPAFPGRPGPRASLARRLRPATSPARPLLQWRQVTRARWPLYATISRARRLLSGPQRRRECAPR